MIRSFRDHDTRNVFERIHVKRWAPGLQRTARRKLLQLHQAITLPDLAATPGHHLEKLRGNRAGQYSIRVNAQWRVCFEWKDTYADNVEITDYH